MKTLIIMAGALMATLMCAQNMTPVVEMPQGNLARFFAKAQKEEPVVVGFLGGSITEGAGASNGAKCWRALTCNWLRTRYPAAKWNFINAAIGGTGSELGVFRLHQEILDRAVPDLVFVEFAVNDQAATDRAKVVRCMEGIVRQIRQVNPQASIVFVYTISRQILDKCISGQASPATAFHKEVAKYYGLPEIDLQKKILELNAQGDFRWEDYWMDAAHPNDRGHAYYTAQVTAFLEEQSKMGVKEAGELPPPLVTPTYENARLLPLKVGQAIGWTEIAAQAPFQGARVQSIAQTNTVGAELESQFEGAVLGLYYESGPDTGQFEVIIDELPPIKIGTFDPAVRFRRPNFRVLKSDLTPGAHRLRIINRDVPQGSKDSILRLGGILIVNP